MALDSYVDGKTEPSGKRTVRRNRYGILYGYIGRTKWETITCMGLIEYSEAEQIAAEAWINKDPDWVNAPWR